jgi:hypothetical protein
MNPELLSFLPPGLGNMVSETVTRFAESRGLGAELWVHDVPLWSVSKLDKSTGTLRRLQIGAYWIRQAPELRLVPQVFLIDMRRKLLIAPKQIRAELIKVVPIWELSEHALFLALKEAWATTIEMPPPDPDRDAAIPLSVEFASLSQ